MLQTAELERCMCEIWICPHCGTYNVWTYTTNISCAVIKCVSCKQRVEVNKVGDD